MAASRIHRSVYNVLIQTNPISLTGAGTRSCSVLGRLQRLDEREDGTAKNHLRPFPRARRAHVCSFSTSTSRWKKGGKAVREEKRDAGKATGQDDPYDFSDLDSEIAKATERLKNDLSKLRAGGRFNPETVESLRVQANKETGQMVRLSDLAQCIPKGRQLHILVGDKEHVRPISSAISSSSLSLTPQPDPTGANPLLLVINIPPPTAESRRAASDEASKAGEKASTSVRDARGRQQKKLRAIQLAKAARPDDLKKAGTQMEKVVEKATGEIKKIVDQAKKVLDSG